MINPYNIIPQAKIHRPIVCNLNMIDNDGSIISLLLLSCSLFEAFTSMPVELVDVDDV